MVEEGQPEWDDPCAEAGLRLRAYPVGDPDSEGGEQRGLGLSLCRWDPWGGVALCREDGSLVLAEVVTAGGGGRGDPPRLSLSPSVLYRIHFGILTYPYPEIAPRSRHRNAPPSKELRQPITALDFFSGPGGDGRIAFVQGRSNRVLIARFPELPSYAKQKSNEVEDLVAPAVNIPSPPAAVTPLVGHEAQICCLSIGDSSDGGHLLVSGDEDGVMYVRWAPYQRGGKSEDEAPPVDGEWALKRCFVQAHEGPLFAVSHFRDGTNRFATGGVGGWVKVWKALDEKNGVQCQLKVPVGGCQVTSLCLRPQQQHILVGTLEGDVLAYSAGDTLDDDNHFWPIAFKVQHTDLAITNLSCTGSGRDEVVVAADSSGILRIYRPASASGGAWSVIAECRLGSPPAGVAFSLKRRALLGGSARGFTKVWLSASLPAGPLQREAVVKNGISKLRQQQKQQFPTRNYGEEEEEEEELCRGEKGVVGSEHGGEDEGGIFSQRKDEVIQPTAAGTSRRAARNAVPTSPMPVPRAPPTQTTGPFGKKEGASISKPKTSKDFVPVSEQLTPAAIIVEPSLHSTYALVNRIELMKGDGEDGGSMDGPLSPRGRRAAASVVNIPSHMTMYRGLTPLEGPNPGGDNDGESFKNSVATAGKQFGSALGRKSVVASTTMRAATIRPGEEAMYPLDVRSLFARSSGNTEKLELLKMLNKVSDESQQASAESEWKRSCYL